jgi:hypothetical protein
MATVQFSLTAQQLEALQEFSNPGESLNLTAKRVLAGILVRGNTLSNIDYVESEPTLETDLTSTEWQLRRLDDRIQAIEIGIEANHYPDQAEKYRGQTIAELQNRIDEITLIQKLSPPIIESLEERIEKLEAEIEILTTLTKQPATPNNGELVIFLADSEGEPIQFWSGQVWVDDLDLAYRYKSRQALTRTIEKLKKRKLPGEPFPEKAIAFAPLENLLENGES